MRDQDEGWEEPSLLSTNHREYHPFPMAKEVLSVSQFTDEQVSEAYMIFKASTGGEKAIVRILRKPGASLEEGWREKLCQRFRENIERSLAASGQQSVETSDWRKKDEGIGE